MSGFGANNIALNADEFTDDEFKEPEFSFDISESERFKEFEDNLASRNKSKSNQGNSLNDSQFAADNVDNILGLDLDVEGSSKDPTQLKKPANSGARYLQESHFMSDKGLEYVKKNAHRKIRPRMKHHSEYKNLQNFLIFYQMWGHHMFSKAVFEDFLYMAANLGSKSRLIRNLRDRWISEETNGLNNDQEEDYVFVSGPRRETENDDELMGGTSENNNDEGDSPNVPPVIQTTKRKKKSNNLFFSDDDEDDENDFGEIVRKIEAKKRQDIENSRANTTIEEDNELELQHPQNPNHPEANQDDQDEEDDEDDDLFLNLTSAKSSKSGNLSESAVLHPNKEIGSTDEKEPPVSTQVVTEAVPATSESNNDGIPPFDEFEEEYEAEMEAMREFEG